MCHLTSETMLTVKLFKNFITLIDMYDIINGCNWD